MNKEMFYNIRVKDVSTAEEAPIPRLIMTAAEEEELDLPVISPMPIVAQRAAAKFSASVLRRDENGVLVPRAEAMVTERVPAFGTVKVQNAALKGTANHLFMQFADFNRAEADVEREADRLLNAGFITADQRSLMDTEAISLFFKSDLYGEMKASPRLYREKRFTTRVPADLFAGQGEDAPLLQGVIDCFYQNADGGFTLVDYKSDVVRPYEEHLLVERHGVQLGLYRLYIEKITGKKVTKAFIYSFALGKAIDCGNPAEL